MAESEARIVETILKTQARADGTFKEVMTRLDHNLHGGLEDLTDGLAAIDERQTSLEDRMKRLEEQHQQAVDALTYLVQELRESRVLRQEGEKKKVGGEEVLMHPMAG
ncbi:hypothetical protein MNV49_002157 [Pseudohyphozyma bogoriensis]|nr:hypothetical protein MNV49_002157 [Pseudohyphozyma bogoriensis]